MGEKLIVGPVDRGLRTDREPFNVDNDSFPTLINAYQWRGRVKRKRGTELLGRLSRFLGTTNGAGALTVTIAPTPITSGIVSFTVGTDIFTDPGGASPVTLITNGAGSGTLDRATGVLTITGSQLNTAVIEFPSLPVMGLRDLTININQFPGTIAFDTKYSYNITPAIPATIYDVSFYKNPLVDPTNLPGYVRKGTPTPTTWNGQDYQQFWTTNYQGAFWATNGIATNSGIFNVSNIGMQFGAITGMTITSAIGPNGPSIVNLTIVGNPLVIGDFVFINEVVYAAPNLTNSINFQTGYVTNVVGAVVTVEFPDAFLTGVYASGGIAQYLTNRSDATKDCIRWYDGDPTNGSPTAPTYGTNNGWVNFMPPLSRNIFSIINTPERQFYLVGARGIVPFKDRLLFLGPVIQASTGNPIYLQDTIIYSQNGTPFYTATFTGDPSLATTTFFQILVPDNQTATPNAYWADQTGFGGAISAGVDQPIVTFSPNQDALIVGFDRIQTRVIYTENDIVPFNFYLINSELGSSSTFSSINMDKGVLTRGNRGFIITNQVEARRIDLDIPDQVFELSLVNNGTERVTAQRDFINEWVYFTYSSNEVSYKFPNQTLQFNYRDNSWAIFNECFTTYGQFRPASGWTWSTIGLKYPTWSVWNDPWDSGQSTLLQAQVIGGNQQGFVLIRSDGTGEANSLTIQNLVTNTVTCPNHCLNTGDYIIISGVQGTIASQVNNQIFSVAATTTNTFVLNPSVPGGTYLGGGLIKRMYVPFIQTKAFPVAWNMGRKTRLGPQQYLFSTTPNGQIQLLIFLSQTTSPNTVNPQIAYNNSPVVPSTNVINNALVYSTVLYTCPESTNLGLTAANTNLQMIADPQTGITQQQQIWHRMNTSLIGDTVQIGFTLSDSQMRDTNLNNQFAEIEFHSMVIDINPSQMLA